MEKSNCKVQDRPLAGQYLPLERCIGPQQLGRGRGREDGKQISRAL